MQSPQNQENSEVSRLGSRLVCSNILGRRRGEEVRGGGGFKYDEDTTGTVRTLSEVGTPTRGKEERKRSEDSGR
jgi:hypothetical protein